ncbi:guided entry of tail-anchored proteins factor CAMLG [Lampetra fluviatilis]
MNEEVESVRLRAERRRNRLLQNPEERMRKILGHGDMKARDTGRLQDPEKEGGEEGIKGDVSPPQTLPKMQTKEQNEEKGGSPTHPAHATEHSTTPRLRLPRTRGPSRAELGERSLGGGQTPPSGLENYFAQLDQVLRAEGYGGGGGTAEGFFRRRKEVGGGVEEEDEEDEGEVFRLLRLLCSAMLALFVRIFVVQYLSIFAPFLTLQVALMGIGKFFPQYERRVPRWMPTELTRILTGNSRQRSVSTGDCPTTPSATTPSATTPTATAFPPSAATALRNLWSPSVIGIASQGSSLSALLPRLLRFYARLTDACADLAVYFFTILVCHEGMRALGAEMEQEE